ncbi:molecular chaperone [Pseudomonas sp. dw_358]|uniref:molecular chaperone n=1 Tax=Pseudomonas sp. dw_358 TaxID=2720083 RepID=UPI001BD5E803|nr:molecular chaperone [Pseudomonas sp. dw_358]
MKGSILLLVCLGLFCSAAQGAVQLNIGGLYDYLPGTRSSLLKRVRNGGDTTAFVRVSVAEIVYNAQGQPEEISLEGVPAAERPLVASPARLIVPANGMQSVRLLFRGERDHERYFRLRFIPVLPEANEGFDIDAAQAQAYQEQMKAGVNILAGYGSLLFVRPAQTRFSARVDDQARDFGVPNDGNATVVLDHVINCTPDGLECADATKHHLLPGSQRRFEKKPGRVYRFDLIQGEKREHVELDG